MKNILIIFLSFLVLNFNVLFASCNLCQRDSVNFVNICSQNCSKGIFCGLCIDRLYLDDKKCSACASDLIASHFLSKQRRRVLGVIERIDIEVQLAMILANCIPQNITWESFINGCLAKNINLKQLFNSLKTADYNIYFIDCLGNSVLHAISMLYNIRQDFRIVEFVQFLLDFEFDLNLLNKKGETVLDLLSKEDCLEEYVIVESKNSLFDLLKERGAKKSEELSVIVKNDFEYDDLDPMPKIIDYLSR